MTDHAPSPETVRLIARILGARHTRQEEVPDLISSVHRAVEGLSDGAGAAVPPTPGGDSAAATPRRGRRARAREVFAPAAEPAPVSLAPQLMRRADMTPAESAPAETSAKTRTGLRGVVKWYDPKTRIGSLRLPGHDDIAVDADALDRAGVPRLFKGQEIEASVVVEADGVARLLAVSLPGRPETEPLRAAGGSRRQQKPVVIEMKRDALRRVGARLEAEQILGGNRR
jgi:cold shock CspA family protein